MAPSRQRQAPSSGRHVAPSARTIHRRRFLLGTVAGLGGLGAAVVAADLASGSGSGGQHKVPAQARRPKQAASEVVHEKLASGVVVPRAQWLIEENARPGTLDWVVTGIQTPHAIEGYASQVSAQPGDDVIVFVNTTAPAFHVEAYRMGYYKGLGGRLVSQTDSVKATPQPQPTFTSGVNMIECRWSPSITIKVTKAWPPGNYLLKLVGDGTGQPYAPQQYVPLCIRDDASTAAYVLQNSVTTWQAYNLWGGLQPLLRRQRLGRQRLREPLAGRLL